MSAGKYTPGPWVYARDEESPRTHERPRITTVALCCDFVIGLPSEIPGGNYRDGDPTGDPEADARLIAAAPDLLETLQCLQRAYRQAVKLHDPNTEDLYTLAVRIAIAKALGGQV